MWRVWLMFDPRSVIIGLHVFLAVLAFSIHFILLSTDRYNWLEGSSSPSGSSAAATVVEEPQKVARLD